MAGKAVTKKEAASVPRKTVIRDQPHMLAYITPYEAEILMARGGTGEPGPGNIPSYPENSSGEGGYGLSADDAYGGGAYGGLAGSLGLAGIDGVFGPSMGNVSGMEAYGGFFGPSDGGPYGDGQIGAGPDFVKEVTEQLSEAIGDVAEEVDNVESATDRWSKLLETVGLEASNENLEAIAADPAKFLEDRGLNISDLGISLDPNADGTTLDPNDPNYKLNGDFTYEASQPDAQTVTNLPEGGKVSSVDTATAAETVMGKDYTINGQNGEIRDENLVNADEYAIDMQGAATGVNKDGTRNLVGEALNDFASQSFSTVIDTSTVSGKLLANKMGEGNYLDSKATILGQMKVLSDEFKDANGNPKIPAWAQATARNISRTIAFKGVSGTAATAAMSNAMMESTIGIAEAEAKFFQTLTIENLDNRQEAIINKANVLSKFELENLAARSAAAVQNAKAFLEMDLTNLNNDQQAEVLNKQARIEALFNDVAEINVNRRFDITNELENERFYDNLRASVEMHNSSELNAMASRNADRADTAAQWRAETELTRAKWESEMAYNIDVANANWRKTVETENTKLLFDSAAMDIRNSLGLTTETLNRLWDRVDAEIDYIWKSVENDEDRDYEFLIAEMQAAGAAAQAKARSKGSLLGSILGAVGQLGAAAIAASDKRLKEDIRLFDTLPNGVKIYTWTWNEEAKRVGADKTPGFGVIAQEIMETHPDAVVLGEDGYLKVNYGMIL